MAESTTSVTRRIKSPARARTSDQAPPDRRPRSPGSHRGPRGLVPRVRRRVLLGPAAVGRLRPARRGELPRAARAPAARRPPRHGLRARLDRAAPSRSSSGGRPRTGTRSASTATSTRARDEMSAAGFREDLRRARDSVEAAANTRSLSYRAAEWSIREPACRRARNTRGGWLHVRRLDDAGARPSATPPIRRAHSVSPPRAGRSSEVPPLSGRAFGVRLPLGGAWPFRLLSPQRLARAEEEARSARRARGLHDPPVGARRRGSPADGRPACGACARCTSPAWAGSLGASGGGSPGRGRSRFGTRRACSARKRHDRLRGLSLPRPALRVGRHGPRLLRRGSAGAGAVRAHLATQPLATCRASSSRGRRTICTRASPPRPASTSSRRSRRARSSGKASRPRRRAGYSLGNYAAMVAAGASRTRTRSRSSSRCGRRPRGGASAGRWARSSARGREAVEEACERLRAPRRSASGSETSTPRRSSC
jgi:hypothetical protein